MYIYVYIRVPGNIFFILHCDNFLYKNNIIFIMSMVFDR